MAVVNQNIDLTSNTNSLLDYEFNWDLDITSLRSSPKQTAQTGDVAQGDSGHSGNQTDSDAEKESSPDAGDATAGFVRTGDTDDIEPLNYGFPFQSSSFQHYMTNGDAGTYALSLYCTVYRTHHIPLIHSIDPFAFDPDSKLTVHSMQQTLQWVEWRQPLWL